MEGEKSLTCSSCKQLRRGCSKECLLAPYFPANDDPNNFAKVYRVYGLSSIKNMLQKLPVHQRGDAVKSLVYEAGVRLGDPVYGCAGVISYLQSQVSQLQMELAEARAQIACMQPPPPSSPPSSPSISFHLLPPP